jgi:7-cyano-7-deazaguanine synthase in queuosine biosynthesis
VIQARTVRYLGATSRKGHERWTLHFQADAVDFPVHVVYHDPPDLPADVWSVCLEELAMACLVDVTTASMATRTSIEAFDPGVTGWSVFVEATRALRREVLYDWSHSLSRMPLEVRVLGPHTTASRLPEPDPNRVLLLMGGGKDSLYVYRLLHDAGYEVQCFYMTEARRTWQQLRRVQAALAGEVKQHRAFVDVGRRGRLTEAFGPWYRSQYQIGQIVATALPYALSQGCAHMALGLELTSDLPMATYRGVAINHQHQKSTDFIGAMNRHLRERLHGAVQLVSPVKGLYDLGIYARFLERAPELARLQSSCGGANTHRANCGRCAKCAFLSALLAGLSGDRALYDRLFPTDPLATPGLFREWLDDGDTRPLTCAGTKAEVRMGLELARRRDWPLGWYGREGSAQRPSRMMHDLERLVRSYPNPLVPTPMGRRLDPHLEYDRERLVRLVA